MSYRYKNPQIYIAKLSSTVRERDLEERFDKYGDIRKVQVKNGYAFIEYYDYRDAEYAIERMNGRTFEGHRIVVQASMGKRRKDGTHERERERDRSYSRDRRRDPERKRGPQANDVCFNCGVKGHWFNECPEPRKVR